MSSIDVNAQLVKVGFDEATRAVIVEWFMTPDSHEFKTVLNHGLELARQHGATKWIGDTRELGMIDPNDQDWANQDWFPRAIHSGIKDMGVVISDDVLSKMTVEDIMNEVKDLGFTSRYFSTLEEAKDWIAKQ